MKKVALTAVAVLGLGLAACQDNAADNNASTVNTIESEAEADTNVATNDAATSADALLNNLSDSAGNVADAAGNVAEDAGNAVDNATTNNR
ncbi:MAG: hypothetical protein AVDCRST_MAG44-1055 [uncultured Sphingomonas sp.]|uniref:Circumsporozoite protein n=1 Tax=uncultured Sphingomonas sp. TaxID=158754 RepID=A0A6J4STY4_9SPHN|nr:MAG: hypothetical protein AVDCRST_MAG44-1055 [uncultured Sphingomonas sp.]